MEKHSAKRFQKRILDFHKKHGRHELPWRQTTDPYLILVSELMLQQTQVERVIPKYNTFITIFPNVESLADAPLGDVLRLWSGLGYNKRARFLHQAARDVQNIFNGNFPQTFEDLKKLSGVGPYTAGALMTFAFNLPTPMIETNIRSVYIHEFFKSFDEVTDAELWPYIESTLYRENPREWYAALMDYGAHIKKTTKNPSRKSRHHTKQTPFKGSLREVRGKILPSLFGT